MQSSGSQRSTREVSRRIDGRRTRPSRSDIAANPLLSTTYIAELAKNPEKSEAQLKAHFGSDFRERLQIAATNPHQLLRLAGAMIKHGWTSEKIIQALFSARDARLAKRTRIQHPDDPRPDSVIQTDVINVLHEMSGWAPAATVKAEGSTKRNGRALSQRESSSRPGDRRRKRKAVMQSGECSVLAPYSRANSNDRRVRGRSSRTRTH
jgi:hypothetical protein